MQFRREPYSDGLVAEMKPLLAEHFHEIAHFPDIALEPDFEVYRHLDEGGALRIYTARTESGELAGYSIFVVRYNPHYRRSLQANQDVLFLHPRHRKSRNGFQFIVWCDTQLAMEQVQVVYHHVKAAHDFGPMLERIGYERVDLIYARRLDR